jgi:hypothetical protein
MRITINFILCGFLCWLACLPVLAQAQQLAATGAPGSIALGSDQITYYAQAGDTLSSIAQKLTARSANGIALGKFNRIDKDSNIPIGAAIVIPASLLPDEPNEGKIVAFSGRVSATAANGAAIAIAPGSIVREGAQLETGGNSFLTLALADQSRLSLPSNSRIKLSKMRMARYTNSPRTEVTLLQGRVESRISPLTPNRGLFEIRTPLSVTGVRGTHFRVSLAEQHSANEVLSGSVEVSRPGAPGTLLLSAGQGNLVSAKGIGRAVNLLPMPQLSRASPSIEGSSLQFDLLPLAGASAYQVQIATDSDMQNILAESRSEGRQLKIPGLPQGTYFARISALDGSGLEGMSGIWKFALPIERQATIAPSPAACGTNGPPASRALNRPRALTVPPSPGVPFIDSNDRANLCLRWHGAAEQKFLVQIARDPAFSWLLLSAHTDSPAIRLPRPAFGTYYARVQEIAANGSTGAFSLAQAFVVTDHWVIHDGEPFSVKENSLRGR